MIVPSMTLHEIRKALVYDYEHEVHARMKADEIIAKGKWIRGGRKDFIETNSFITNTKNKWRIIVNCDKGLVSTNAYVISYNEIGITASHFLFGLDTEHLMHFNTHFFKRYKERLKINIDKPEDLVKYFFRHNLGMIPSYFPMDDGTKQLFCSLNGGVGLGKYYEEESIHEFKTFVDNSLLRNDQKEQIQQIWIETLNELTNEINRRLKKMS
ncbi:MAG: hypothetical protein RL708_1238 [Bacteroidota bacterium]|jgi:hypothetical protein